MNSLQWFLYLCIFKGCVCCDPFDMDRKEHPTLTTAFLECTFKGRWEIVHCPLVSGRIGIYDNRLKKCRAFGSTEQGLREKRQSATLPTASGSQRVGEECNFNTDCVSGGYCETGACKCWSTHVAIQSYCWRKVNPEQAGCSHDEQCSAVWPGARCVNSVCKCPNDRTPSPTREGPVCHSLGQCPTNGAHPLLYDRNTNTPSRCFFFDLPPDLPRADRFLGCDDFPDMYDCIDGFCCPTRAFACTQATDSGQQLSGFVGGLRWYYNAASQSCQTFNYLGVGGNANNFLTKEQCESYCLTRCIRGQPQLDQTLSSNNNLASLVSSCSTRAKGAALNTCDETRYECSRIESLTMCCPLPAYICSNFGGIGRANNDTTPPPFSTGSNRLGQPELVRWYWDSSTKTCQTFRYLGQGGNFNNFLSEQDCVEYCSKSLCPHGVPLQENSGPSNMLCAKNNDCPASHYCISTVCCPTADTVCNQPLALGAFCNASPMTRYWYNSAQAACEAFEFNGCQGNANNFGTIVDCQRFCSDIKEEPQCQQGKALRTSSGAFYQCSLNSGSVMQCPTNYECTYDGTKHGCCPSKSYICQQNFNVGTMCNPSTSSRWYFDSVAQSCKTFQYYGCDGNANNFATQRDCENFCEISGCPDGGQVLKDTFGNALLCTSNVAICPVTHECTQLDSRTVMSTGSYCCPTRMSICAQASDKGSNCGQNVQRYAFHGESNTCEAFQFLGCGGNANNFLSKEICLNLCHAAACLRGEVVYRHPTTRIVVECEFSGINQSCPQGFRCVFNPLTKRNICCGSPKLGLCPRNQLVYLDARNHQARHCTANLAGVCPKDWSCLFNTDFNQFFCCGDPYQSLCSLNSSLLRNRATGDPVGCSLKNKETCPHGYSCQTSPMMMSGFCCESKSSIHESVCPAGFVGLSTSQEDRNTCSPLISSSCPDQFFCIFSEMHSRFTCCQKGDLAEHIRLCPPNSTALLSAEAQRPQTCLFGEDASCPPPYVCEQRDSGIGLCCRSTTNGKIGGGSVEHIQPFSNKILIAQTKAAQLEQPMACAKGTVLSSSGDRCLKAMSPLEFGCIESIQCLKNSYCSQRFCVCRKGFVVLGKTCYEHCPLGWIEFHNKCVLHNRKLISVNWRNPT